MKEQRKPRKTDALLQRLREKLQQGVLFDPLDEAKQELARELKGERKKRTEVAKEA